MDTDTYNCNNINTYTDIYPILVAGSVLTLTHLVANDSFEDGRWSVVIILTLCVVVGAITGTCSQPHHQEWLQAIPRLRRRRQRVYYQ